MARSREEGRARRGGQRTIIVVQVDVNVLGARCLAGDTRIRLRAPPPQQGGVNPERRTRAAVGRGRVVFA